MQVGVPLYGNNILPQYDHFAMYTIVRPLQFNFRQQMLWSNVKLQDMNQKVDHDILLPGNGYVGLLRLYFGDPS